MSKKKYPRKRQKSLPVIPMVLGFLFLSFGILAMALPKSNQNAQPSSNSVIPVPVNYAAPELALQNIQGETKSLTEFRGQVVLVNNWATWCPPCKAEMPILSAYYNEHTNKGFMIIAIEAGDPLEGVAQFASNYGLQFQVWLDPNNAALQAFRNGNLPNSYVIDRSGNIRYAWTGEISRAMLEKYVTPLIEAQN